MKCPALLHVAIAILWLAVPGTAQSFATGPTFDVASVKATPHSVTSNYHSFKDLGGPGTDSPTRWICTACGLLLLIQKAWEVDFFQIAAWERLTGVDYDITANVPPGASPADFLLMIQRLLAERIDLEVHMERQEQAVMELVIAKGGIKMTPAETIPEGGPPPSAVFEVDSRGIPQLPPGFPRPIHTLTAMGHVYAGRSRTIAELARQLETPISQLIVDHTGLTGKYDYFFHCSRDEVDNETYGALAIGECLKLILPEQLGLQLKPVKAMVDMLKVDRFNKQPSEN